MSAQLFNLLKFINIAISCESFLSSVHVYYVHGVTKNISNVIPNVLHFFMDSKLKNILISRLADEEM